MRIGTDQILVAANASATYPAANNGAPAAVALESIYGFSMIVKSLAGQTGTLKVQVSNSSLKALFNGSDIWADLPAGSLAIAGAATQTVNFDAIHYKWLRLNHTSTGGVGNITVEYASKGA